MAAIRHLNNAPIKEALIDIRVAHTSDYSLDSLETAYSSIESDYPNKEVIHKGQFGINITENEASASVIDQKKQGYKYSTDDGKQIVQFRLDGFTFSRLEPYESWESMKDEALRLWGYYVQGVEEATVERIAVRYVNVLKLPLPLEFSEYLSAPPTIPHNLSKAISTYLTRIVIQDPVNNADCIIMQAMEGVTENNVPIVLDIDAFITRQFDIKNDKYWDVLEQLREFKNKVFFESITEKSAELFL